MDQNWILLGFGTDRFFDPKKRPLTEGGEDGEGPAPEMSRGGYGGGRTLSGGPLGMSICSSEALNQRPA